MKKTAYLRASFENDNIEDDVRDDDTFNKKLEAITIEEYYMAIVKISDIIKRNPNIIIDCCGYDFYLGDKIISTTYTQRDLIKHWICLNPIVMI